MSIGFFFVSLNKCKYFRVIDVFRIGFFLNDLLVFIIVDNYVRLLLMLMELGLVICE